MITFLICLAIIFGVSWALTCGVLWLAAWCFGLVFNLKVATGVWLIFLLIRSLFKASNSADKK